jgi:gluconate 2-dehydrogenase gamma chain
MEQTIGTFFDEHQRQTIEAAMARIIPTDDQPGAREAGTVDFVDRYLSGIDYVFAKPDGSGFERLEGMRADAWRQRIAILREKYVAGIEDLDRRSQRRFGAPFIELDDEQQDKVLTAMERGEGEIEAALSAAQSVAGFAPAEPAMQQASVEIELDFFRLLALHTRQGFYADPIYGGNRDRAGWRLIGFDGPESLAETHAGLYTTRPYFSETQIDWKKESEHGA